MALSVAQVGLSDSTVDLLLVLYLLGLLVTALASPIFPLLYGLRTAARPAVVGALGAAVAVGLVFALSAPDFGLGLFLAEALAPVAFFAGFFLAGHSLSGEHPPAFSSSPVDLVLACFAGFAVIVSAVLFVLQVLESLQEGSFLGVESIVILLLGTVGVLSNGYICYRLLEDRRERPVVVGRHRR